MQLCTSTGSNIIMCIYAYPIIHVRSTTLQYPNTPLHYTVLYLILVTGDLGVEGGEGYREGLERANGVLQVHRELVLAHAAELWILDSG